VADVGSQLKKAHRTHALAQPAGAAYPHDSAESVTPGSPSGEAERLYAELCRRVPGPEDRAAMLVVPLEQDDAWRGGRQLPLLRARRKSLAAALADLTKS
jgi:hypothetical protein